MYEQYHELATKVRAHCCRMVHLGKSGHIGSMLSAADIMAVLYSGVLNVDPRAAAQGGSRPLYTLQGACGRRGLRHACGKRLLPARVAGHILSGRRQTYGPYQPLCSGRGIFHRFPGPRPARGGGHGAGRQAQGPDASRVLHAQRRRYERRLHLGSDHVRRATPPGQSRLHHWITTAYRRLAFPRTYSTWEMSARA